MVQSRLKLRNGKRAACNHGVMDARGCDSIFFFFFCIQMKFAYSSVMCPFKLN